LINVLYVSDNPDSHTSVCHYLEQNGTIEIIPAFSEAEARVLLHLDSIDFIISDTISRDGRNAAVFKEMIQSHNIPFILMSGDSCEVYLSPGPGMGPDTCLIRSDGNKRFYAGITEIVNRTAENRRLTHGRIRNEDLFKTFFNMPLAGSALVTNDKRWLLVNDRTCEILGYSRKELLHNKWTDLTPPEDLSGDLIRYNDAIKGTLPPVTMEKRYIRKDGGTIYTRLSVFPVRDCNDEILCFATVIEDVTRQKKAEEELKKKNEDLTDACRKMSDAEERVRKNYDELAEKTGALLLNEEKFRTIFEKSPVAIALVGPDFYFRMVNKKFSELLGYSQEELVKMTFAQVTHPGPVDFDVSVIKDIISGRRDEYQTEKRYLRKDGTVIWGALSASAIKNKKGRVVAIIALVNDISERKIAEEALAQSEELHRSLFQASPSGIVYLGNEGTITASSPMVLSLLHLSSEKEVNGTSIFDWIVPEDRERVQCDIRNMQQGNACTPDVYRIMRRDGSQFSTEISAALVFRNDGSVNGMVALIRDITERITAEKALRESEEKYRDLVENLNIGIFRSLFDESGAIIETNTFFARMFGFELKEQLRGLSLKDFYAHPDDRTDIHKETISPGHIVRRELQMRKKDGSVFWVSIIAHIPGSPRTAPQFVEGTIEDITERKHSEDMVRSTNRKLSLLSSITRHDIQNQLMALQGYQELLRDHLTGCGEKELLDKQIHIAAGIERQILFTREYQQMGLEAPVWQDVRRIIEKARSQVNTGDIIVDNRISGTEIRADAMLGKVFDNLIENAVRYGDTITTIIFYTRETPDGLVLVCEDDGTGIPEDEKEKIFIRGFGRNTGLGLFLAREILSISGITIRETGEPGGGARFEMNVPHGAYRFL
jgi:PAS domain S-box-containing protein